MRRNNTMADMAVIILEDARRESADEYYRTAVNISEAFKTAGMTPTELMVTGDLMKIAAKAAREAVSNG